MCTSDIYTDSTLVHHESKHIERRGVEKRHRTGGEKGGGPPSKGAQRLCPCPMVAAPRKGIKGVMKQQRVQLLCSSILTV
ncbi:hypothetical protein CFC21_100457 [Triticum aestivum]|uniref:Uncharacterized protein n=2 Tax=Triticum aestivum TaxID=4565 RepID=A0A3B6RS70_WHEAT|nr:hypothetical protein CFC21_100457 [Triticum aestivum]